MANYAQEYNKHLYIKDSSIEDNTKVQKQHFKSMPRLITQE